MNRNVLSLLLLCSVAWISGCGVTVEPNAAPVEVTFNVSQGGKAVTDVKLNLQAIAKGAGAFGDVKNGVAKVTLIPGTYTYFVESQDDAALKGIPEAYLSGSMERKLEIADASPIELKLD
jgi:hypothetical protein